MHLEIETKIYIGIFLLVVACMVPSILQFEAINPELTRHTNLLRCDVTMAIRLDGTEQIPYLGRELESPGAFATAHDKDAR